MLKTLCQNTVHRLTYTCGSIVRWYDDADHLIILPSKKINFQTQGFLHRKKALILSLLQGRCTEEFRTRGAV
jgi:hypothetical protein